MQPHSVIFAAVVQAAERRVFERKLQQLDCLLAAEQQRLNRVCRMAEARVPRVPLLRVRDVTRGQNACRGNGRLTFWIASRLVLSSRPK